MQRNDHDAALVQLRAYLTNIKLDEGQRLPAERTLSSLIGVPRPVLRKALQVLEDEGRIWRHVGKGTFIGNRPEDTPVNIAEVARTTTPAEVIQTRLLLEPEFAASAAIHALPSHISDLRACARRSRAAASWREYETTDNDFHRLVVVASQNSMLLAMMDMLQSVRRTITWTRHRPADNHPPADHHSFDEHEAVIDAIASRDAQRAREAMDAHIQTVARLLLRPGLTG